MQKPPPLPKPDNPELSGLTGRRPGDLKPWPGNARIHSQRQISQLKASIRSFGFTAPVIIDETDTILSGHGRVTAALDLKLDSIPVRVLAGMDEHRKRAFVLADNKLAELSKWDNDLLRHELTILSSSDIEIEITGFSTAEVDLMLDVEGTAPKPDEDEPQASDIAETPVSQTGDLWLLGEHALLCGDALEEGCYARLLGDEKAQLVCTDAPYNVPIKNNVSGNGKLVHTEFAMASGEMSPAEFTTFLSRAFANMKAFSMPGAVVFSFLDWRHIREFLDGARPHFGEPRQLCVWAKTAGSMGTFYRSQHELCYVFRNGEVPHINNFGLGAVRYRTNVWTYAGMNVPGKGHALLTLHPTVKPVAMIADAIRDCSHRKGLVLDPFAGSGTILIACERTGRRARAIEFEPRYVDVGLRRWMRVTGGMPVLASTGQTWTEVGAARKPGQGATK